MTARVKSLVLLDVGSTNSRAWRVTEGEIIATHTLAVGVRNNAREGSSSAVSNAVRELIQTVDPRGEALAVAAAGMIGSAEGLFEVDHLPAPAGAADLAAGAIVLTRAEAGARPFLIVPGVRTPAATHGVVEDVMRGEETLVAGLLDRKHLAPGERLLNAGSHWKLITVDEHGRIAASRTSLGGEVVHALQSSTMLSASLPGGPLESLAEDWLEEGAASARRDGLLRSFFAVRLLDQRGGTTPQQRLSWLVGACISDDIGALLGAGMLSAGDVIAISGPGAVPAAWAHLLQRRGCFARILPPDVVQQGFVSGLWRIAATRLDLCDRDRKD